MSTESAAADTPNAREAPKKTAARIFFAALALTVVAAVARVLWHSAVFKPTFATVTLPALGQPGELPLTLQAGSRVGFGMRVGQFTHAGPRYVLVQMDLLRDGRRVARRECRAFQFDGGAGSGSDRTQYSGGCVLTVPAGGATSVRAVATQEGDGSLTMRGVTLLLYRP